MDWTLEVVILPVSDIDRSVAFYRDQVGFHLDHDTTNEFMHVVQLTPQRLGLLDRDRRPADAARDGARLDPRPPARRRRCGGRAPGAARPRRRGQRDHGLRRARRRHVLRLQRPGRQHLVRPAAQGPRREAARSRSTTASASPRASRSRRPRRAAARSIRQMPQRQEANGMTQGANCPLATRRSPDTEMTRRQPAAMVGGMTPADQQGGRLGFGARSWGPRSSRWRFSPRSPDAKAAKSRPTATNCLLPPRGTRAIGHRRQERRRDRGCGTESRLDRRRSGDRVEGTRPFRS